MSDVAHGPLVNSSLKHDTSTRGEILFVCLEFIVPLENFSLIWRRSIAGEGRAANFDLCSALMAIEQ